MSPKSHGRLQDVTASRGELEYKAAVTDSTSRMRSRVRLALTAMSALLSHGIILSTALAQVAPAAPPTPAPLPADPAPDPLPAPPAPALPAEVAAPEPAPPPAPPPAAVEPSAPPALPVQQAPAAPPEKKKEHFFDRINVRGYTQFRYNELARSNEDLNNLQGDRSVGGNAGISVRRARLVLSGEIHPQIEAYLQTDFAGTVGDTLHLAQVRDWYFDIAIDAAKELRFRIGQSKVPFGYENMQSSQNRLPLDRSDALNSALNGERDLGVFFYYAPASVRRLFKHLTDSGLKGSGDYGMLGVGVFNGQTINRADANANKHVVARITYPFELGDQIFELGGGGYTGKVVVNTSDEVTAPEEVRDARAALALVLYPQPFGLLAEYNIGTGPELTDFGSSLDAAGAEVFTGTVRRRSLHGGFVLASLRLEDVVPGVLTPFARVASYEGGKKHETNAPSYSVRELEAGAEWQFIKPLELTVAYQEARRTSGRAPYERESGRLVRVQLQVNY